VHNLLGLAGDVTTTVQTFATVIQSWTNKEPLNFSTYKQK